MFYSNDLFPFCRRSDVWPATETHHEIDRKSGKLVGSYVRGNCKEEMNCEEVSESYTI